MRIDHLDFAMARHIPNWHAHVQEAVRRCDIHAVDERKTHVQISIDVSRQIEEIVLVLAQAHVQLVEKRFLCAAPW